MTEKTLTRVFKYKDDELLDPNPRFSVDKVLDFYSNQYPELTNASAKETREADRILYTIETNMGQKG